MTVLCIRFIRVATGGSRLRHLVETVVELFIWRPTSSSCGILVVSTSILNDDLIRGDIENVLDLVLTLRWRYHQVRLGRVVRCFRRFIVLYLFHKRGVTIIIINHHLKVIELLNLLINLGLLISNQGSNIHLFNNVVTADRLLIMVAIIH